jgi:nucleotide-binding universal stress UspA family protein
MDRIIAATDLTGRSDAVIARAAQIARDTGAALIHAHVLPQGAAAARESDVRARITGALAQGANLQGTEAQGTEAPDIRLLRGHPEQVLSDLVAAEGASLLVLGLHRPRAVLDLLRLTTMERIVLRAAVPVLIARNPVQGPYRRVLASVDFAPASARALAAAARIAPLGEFHAIHALQRDLREKLAPGDIDSSRAMTTAETLRTAFMAMPGIPAQLRLPEIVAGGVHEVLAFRLDELHPDLLTIGTHSGRDPNALGNYARDLMRDPPTDVLVAKPPAA